jgi:hypothetical protein
MELKLLIRKHLGQSQSRSHSNLKTDSQSASLSCCPATIRARDKFFFLFEIFLRQLRVCYFVTPSLTRGRVCNLLLLLDLDSSVPLGPESRGSQGHIFCANFWDSPNLQCQFLRLKAIFFVPIFETPPTCSARSQIHILQGQGGPVIPPGTGSLSIASCGSLGYGGVIVTRLYTVMCRTRTFIWHSFNRMSCYATWSLHLLAAHVITLIKRWSLSAYDCYGKSIQSSHNLAPHPSIIIIIIYR